MGIEKLGQIWYCDWGLTFSPRDRIRAIQIIKDRIIRNEYVDSGTHTSFQTSADLFNIDQLKKFKTTFVNSVEAIGGRVKDCYAWGYLDNAENQRTKDPVEQWHAHPGATFSGVFYLKIPDFATNSRSGTQFFDHNPPYAEPRYGRWVIFPSQLLHRPGLMTSTENRIVIAADAICETAINGDNDDFSS